MNLNDVVLIVFGVLMLITILFGLKKQPPDFPDTKDNRDR